MGPVVTFLSAGALAGGIALAVVDMVREARREHARTRARAAHPAGSRGRR